MNVNLEIYRNIFNLKHAEISKIAHTDAIVADVYEIEPHSGSKYILKICPKDRHYFREVIYLEKLQDVTAVPKIIDKVDPRDNNHGAILMEHLPGELLSKGVATPQLAYEIGVNLAKIHDIKTSGYGDLLYPSELDVEPEKYWLKKFNESINECQGRLNNDLIERVRSFAKENIHLLKNADGPCIAHRDFRPGNVIVDDGKLRGIIDWASSRAGFAQEDFQSFEEQEWSADPKMNDAFLKGYRDVRPVPDYKAMFPLLRLERALGLVGYTLKIGTWNGTHSKLYKTNLNYIESIKLK